jgi:hypothetical protein
MHYALHHIDRISAQDLAPLDHLGNVEPPIALFDTTDIAVGALKASSEFALRDTGFCADLRQYGHDPAVAGRPELLRQIALSPKVSQCTLPQLTPGLIRGHG